MSEKHTKGPWHVEYELDENEEKTDLIFVAHTETECDMTAVAHLLDMSATAGEMKANAYLIASAPEMLKMLRGVQHLCECQNSNIDGLDELISKAEGIFK